MKTNNWNARPGHAPHHQSHISDETTGQTVAIVFDDEDGTKGRLIAASPDLLKAAKRALPWLGKMIADGAHKNSVAPNDCVGAMQMLEAAIAKATQQP